MKLVGHLARLALWSTVCANGAVDFEPAGQVPMGPERQPMDPKSRPNIVFILTDDQDLHMQSLDYMPFVQKHLIDQGTFYKRHYCTTALCCPSRVTLWTGKAAHNTNVTNVSPPYGEFISHIYCDNAKAHDYVGGYPKFLSQGLNDKYLPVWLQQVGYNTFYTGKMFNAHAVGNYDSPHAAGWTASVGVPA